MDLGNYCPIFLRFLNPWKTRKSITFHTIKSLNFESDNNRDDNHNRRWKSNKGVDKEYKVRIKNNSRWGIRTRYVKGEFKEGILWVMRVWGRHRSVLIPYTQWLSICRIETRLIWSPFTPLLLFLLWANEVATIFRVLFSYKMFLIFLLWRLKSDKKNFFFLLPFLLVQIDWKYLS